MTKLNQQGVAHLALILILLAGLVAGVYLVQHPQIFKPKASGGILWLVDENGERLPLKEGTDVFEASSQQIHIKINQPIWQASLPGLVGQALAQSTACNGAVYSCSDIKCDDGSTALGTGCYEKDAEGNLTDPNNRYRTECRRNCPTTPTAPTTPQQPAPGGGITCGSLNGQCGDSAKKLRGSGTVCTAGEYKGYNNGTNYTDCDPLSGLYSYCYTGCTTSQTPASPQPGQPAQPQVDNTTPAISGASWDQEGNYLTITGTNFGNSGSVYYSRGGSEQIPSQSVSSWSAGSVKIGAEIPLGSTKSVENIISGGNYLKVCRTDGKCSSFWSPIPERPKFRVDIPTAPKAAPPGAGAPAAPTQPQVPEATDKIRISMDQSKLDSDEACTEDTDPQKHCMKFTPGDLAARALIGKDYVDWWLANKPGETQTIYVRFVSNKGKDYKLNGLDLSIKVVYQPAVGATGGTGQTPAPTAGSRVVVPSATQKPALSPVSQEGSASILLKVDEVTESSAKVSWIFPKTKVGNTGQPEELAGYKLYMMSEADKSYPLTSNINMPAGSPSFLPEENTFQFKRLRSGNKYKWTVQAIYGSIIGTLTEKPSNYLQPKEDSTFITQSWVAAEEQLSKATDLECRGSTLYRPNVSGKKALLEGCYCRQLSYNAEVGVIAWNSSQFKTTTGARLSNTLCDPQKRAEQTYEVAPFRESDCRQAYLFCTTGDLSGVKSKYGDCQKFYAQACMIPFGP